MFCAEKRRMATVYWGASFQPSEFSQTSYSFIFQLSHGSGLLHRVYRGRRLSPVVEQRVESRSTWLQNPCSSMEPRKGGREGEGLWPREFPWRRWEAKRESELVGKGGAPGRRIDPFYRWENSNSEKLIRLSRIRCPVCGERARKPGPPAGSGHRPPCCVGSPDTG